MSFWSKVGEVAKQVGSAAVNEAKSAHERAQGYKAEFLSSSDSELIAVIKNERKSSPLRAGAAFSELKSRGWEEGTIRDAVRS